MTEPQQPKAAPTNNQTTDQAIEEILRSFESKVTSDVMDAMNGRPGARTFGVDDKPRETAKAALSQLLANEVRKAETRATKKAASDIFNLAHEYASQDKTMVGSENLRDYHYYNAIAKIGEFDGR